MPIEAPVKSLKANKALSDEQLDRCKQFMGAKGAGKGTRHLLAYSPPAGRGGWVACRFFGQVRVS